MTSIVDQFGQPMISKPAPKPKARAALTGMRPFDAADRTSQEMAAWNPVLSSPDAAMNPDRDIIVARIRDLVRNDGWASGGVTKICDAVVGADLRLSANPDYRALSAWGPGFDAVWAKEFAAAAEAEWRSWAYDTAKWCDLTRTLPIPGLFRLGFRHLLIDGDALAAMSWRPGRVGPGRAQLATALQLVHPDRLSNPQGSIDTREMRGGVHLDEDGAAVGYHVRRGHQSDYWAGTEAQTWDYVPRETEWGRPVMVHYYEVDEAGQHRGAGGLFAPILARLRMLARYDAAELQQSLVNAIFGAYIESPFDPDAVQDSLEDGTGVSSYQSGRAEFHDAKKLTLNGVRISSLYPGEKMNFLSSSRPSANFAGFENAVLRNVASGLGLSHPQLSQDWSGVNYSSARAALLEAWKTLSRRRSEFSVGFCSPIYGAFLEEVFEQRLLPLPAGAPDFMEARAAYTRCRWIGPGRGWVDPVKEPTGALLRVAGGLTALSFEAMENTGMDLEEILDQRELDEQMFRDRGLPIPKELQGVSPNVTIVEAPEKGEDA
nr:phage portal protein [uncultured Roseococcus sp.]